ncbi:MAG: cyclic pyranopterin monophosphate synthase MoaC [Thermoplasmata archaeon]|nr:cyclic pyranopterin monophosphate synthase MoaC [Thermoplasmata archaeon]
MVKMVDISDKEDVNRTAVAEGKIKLKDRSLKAIKEGKVKKGDVISASQLAGIQAAKDTSRLLPFCHQIPLTSVDVRIKAVSGAISVRTTVTANYKTGVEMEALAGTAAALLNIWDMVKYLEKDKDGQYPVAEISGIKVLRKTKEEH